MTRYSVAHAPCEPAADRATSQACCSSWASVATRRSARRQSTPGRCARSGCRPAASRSASCRLTPDGSVGVATTWTITSEASSSSTSARKRGDSCDAALRARWSRSDRAPARAATAAPSRHRAGHQKHHEHTRRLHADTSGRRISSGTGERAPALRPGGDNDAERCSAGQGLLLRRELLGRALLSGTAGEAGRARAGLGGEGGADGAGNGPPSGVAQGVDRGTWRASDTPRPEGTISGWRRSYAGDGLDSTHAPRCRRRTPTYASPAERAQAHDRRRIVGQHRPQPRLDLGDGHALAPRVVLDLVAADAVDGEVLACGCAKYRPLTLAAGVIANDSVSAMPMRLGVEQVEQPPLLGVVGQAG